MPKKLINVEYSTDVNILTRILNAFTKRDLLIKKLHYVNYDDHCCVDIQIEIDDDTLNLVVGNINQIIGVYKIIIGNC